jgi:hypothetical protein
MWVPAHPTVFAPLLLECDPLSFDPLLLPAVLFAFWDACKWLCSALLIAHSFRGIFDLSGQSGDLCPDFPQQ